MRPFLSSRGSSSSIATTVCSLLSLLSLPAMATAATAADYFVDSLPGAPEGPLLKMHAGLVEVNNSTNANLFFWHYQNRHIANRQRTVIWLNGGPGCSSEDGAMMEIGPYRAKNGHELQYNDGSWDEFANIMFVDNPVGTGFSYVDGDHYVHELDEMADQMVVFLEKWFTMFPHFSHDDLYFAGESYAGQHIPYIAKQILARNKKLKDPSKAWNLKGLLIGNGWISPSDQYPSYLTYSYKNNILKSDSSEAAAIESQQAQCLAALNAPGGHDRVDLQVCEQILQDILKSTITTKKGTTDRECVNMYDIRLRDTWPSCGMNWPPDLPSVTTYLRRDDVMTALHIKTPNNPTPRPWQECYGPAGGAFTAKNSKPSVQLLPDLLKEIPIVLFSGASDLICNHIGTEDLINNLSWNGGKGFEITPGTWAPRRDWMFEGENAGFWQEARNLTYVLFHNSSHMVPFDYARRTRDMLDRFMRVDIANIGGKPTDSRIDGEKGLETSVGGHPNSTAAEEAQKEKLAAAKWSAYYKSGQIALIVVIIVAGLWGWYVWRDRRSRAGDSGVFGGLLPGDSSERLRGAMGLENMRHKRGDVEAGDFDVEELDEFSGQRRHGGGDEQYDLGSDSGEEDMGNGDGKMNGEDKGEGREPYDVVERR